MRTSRISNRDRDLFKTSSSHTQGFIHHYLSNALLFVLGISLIGVVLATTHESVSESDRYTEKLDITGKLEESTQLPSTLAKITQPVTLPALTPTTPEADPVKATESPAKKTNTISKTDQPVNDGWTEYEIKSGDSVSGIFDQHEIHSSLHSLLKSKEARKALNTILAGKTIKFRKDDSGLTELIYEISPIKRLHAKRSAPGKYESSIVEDKIDRKRVSAEGEINSSLFLAGKDAGISDALIMKLVDIFAYDIDFALDIRKGDRFKLVYDERYANGKQISDGPIVAAEFINNGKTIKAVRFEDKKGNGNYYTPKGRSMKKAFLRTPVKFTRISSRFSNARKHPILHKIRAHKGVDYAAPRGTPVKSTGNGKVVFAGTQRGYGKVVIVKHFNKYSTVYAHLKGFRKGIKKGKNVKQGQIIGYVGMTGSATGPHLHYEFRVNGKHKDPLRVSLPNAPALGGKQLAAFKKQSTPLLKQLESATKLAAN